MKFWQTLSTFQKNSQLSASSFWMLTLLALALSLGQWGRIEIGQLVLYPHDVILTSWLILERAIVWSGLVSLFERFKNNLLLFATLTWVLLGMIVASFIYQDLLSWLYFVRLFSYFIFLIIIKRTSGNSNQFLRVLSCFVGIVMAVIGFAQYAILPDTRYLFQYGWDEHYYRLIGTLLDPNYSSLIFIAALWGVVSFKKKLSAKIQYLLSGVLLIAIGLTFSRAGYLALLSSLVIYAFLQTKKSASISKKAIITALGCLVIVLAAIVLAPKPGGEGVDLLRTNSIYARFDASKEFLEILQPWQWIIGAGFYTRPDSIHSLGSHARVPDNLIVLIIYSTGIVGLGLLLKLLQAHASQLNRLAPETIAVISAVVVHAQFNNSLLEPFVFLIIGLCLIGEKQLKAKNT